MTIDEVYKFVLFIANKSQRGNVKPDDFNLAAWRALMEWFMASYGNKNEYQPGRPVPRIAYQKTEKISDDLKDFIESVEMIVPSTTGEVLYPDGVTVKDANGNIPGAYVHHTGTRTKYVKTIGNVVLFRKDIPVTATKEDELGMVLQSEIVGPTKRFPIFAFYSTYMKFYPSDLVSVTLSYLREPVKPVWAFTMQNGRAVYDPANSVDIEAPNDAMNDVMIRILAYIGINLRELELEQYAQLEKKQGI